MDNRQKKRPLLSILTMVVAAAVVWVVFTTLWLWRFQERVVFQPPSVIPDAPAPSRRVSFAASDGHPIYGYLVDPQDGWSERPGRGAGSAAADGPVVVLAFHGNADLAAWTVPWAVEVARRTGAAVFVPEYRGYGGIPGSPTYESAAADARGALDYVRKNFGSAALVLYGHSLGSAVAAEVAREMKPQAPRALVLVSPFTSARDMATRMMVPPIPGLFRAVSRVHYDTRRIVQDLDAPVYVCHGTRDLNIPARMGRQVFAAAKHPGELLLVEGAGHNDVMDVAGTSYWDWIARAVRGGGAGER